MDDDRPHPDRWRALLWICAGVVGVLTTWFSATAILPDLEAAWGTTPAQSAWLTNAVQAGFVLGALAASILNLPDIVDMRRLMALSALVAALSNAALLVTGPDGAIAARIVTGIALAGVYPPALKFMATWFRAGRGFAMGCLIAALTLGSSLPHLVRALGAGLDWRAVVWASTGAALAAAAIFALVLREGPYAFPRATFDPRKLARVLANRPAMLANLGYFGHMWELYAMWAWMLTFAAAAARAGTAPLGTPSLLAFAVVASGVAGCLAGGWLSDRIGRCLTTAGMMAVSGACALAIGAFFDGPALFLGLVAILWGVTIIGDSAQFSAAVSELTDPDLVGSALALQLGVGFGLTIAAIWLVPVAADAMGSWQWAFVVLVPGPLVGAAAMLALRRHPDAARMAGGAR